MKGVNTIMFTITFGSTGLDVKKLQYYLNQILKQEGTTPLKEDGVFGQNTQFAVVIYQYLHGLPIDGIIGSETWNSIIASFNALENPTAETNKSGNTLRIGSTGLAVQKIQGYLNRLNNPTPNLVTDGNFGQRTRQAVISFQTAQNITPDGVIGNLTWDRLISLI